LQEVDEDDVPGGGISEDDLGSILVVRNALHALRVSRLPHARRTADELEQALEHLQSAWYLVHEDERYRVLELAHLAHMNMEDALVRFKAIERPRRILPMPVGE
jgi:hypothetical protein